MKKALFIFLLLPYLVKAQNNRLPVAGSTTKDTVEVLNGLIEDSAFKVKIMNMITGASSDKVVVHASDSTLRELPFPAYTLDQVTANGSTYSANRNIANAGHTIVYTGTGQWLFGGTSSIVGSYVEITSTTTPQLSLVYDGTHFLGIGVASDGTATLTPSGITVKLTAPTTAGASLKLPAGTAPTSPNNGDMYYDGTHLFFKPSGSAVDLLASAATPTLQQVFTAGTTLTGNNTIINGTNTTAWSGAGDNMFGSSTVNATALFQIQTSAQPQLALHNDATHFTTFNAQSGGGITITPSNASSGVNIAGNLVIAGTNQSLSFNGDHTGTITLVSGTKTFTVTNSATSSELLITVQTPTGVTTTVGYSASCTSGSCTVTAYTSGGTTNTGDTSVLRYVLIN